MRDPARINKTLEMLRIVWTLNPDMRLCQLIANAASWHGDFVSRDLFHLEDDDLYEAIYKVSVKGWNK